jgi:ribosome-associated protein
MITVNDHIQLHEYELQESFIRSSGPGGQNVNKVASAVQLRYDARHSKALSNAVFLRLKKLAGSRMTLAGVIVITANSHRTQEANRKEAQDRLVSMIAEAAIAPTYRRPTKPTKASKTRRLEGKNKRADVKKNRGKVNLGRE